MAPLRLIVLQLAYLSLLAVARATHQTAYAVRVASDSEAVSAIVLRTSVLAAYSLQARLPLAKRMALPRVDFLALLPEAAVLKPAVLLLLNSSGFLVLPENINLEITSYKRVLQLWPHGLALRHAPLFADPNIWLYRRNGIASKSDGVVPDTFLTKCPDCAAHLHVPEEHRVPSSIVMRSCSDPKLVSLHVEFHVPPLELAETYCFAQYQQYFKLWLALAFSPGLPRARTVLAMFAAQRFDDRMLLDTVQAAHRRCLVGACDQAWFKTIARLARDRVPNMPADWLARFATELPLAARAKPARKDWAHAPALARGLHQDWLAFEAEDVCKHLPHDEQQVAKQRLEVHAKPARAAKVLYAMVTHQHAHESRALPMMQTWLSRVDALVVLSDVDDPRIGSVPINFEGPQSYENLWAFIRGALTYLTETYFAPRDGGDEFEWLALLADDVFCLPENVDRLLQSADVAQRHEAGQALYMGRRFSAEFADATGDVDVFASGGSLRLFNAKALRLLQGQLEKEWCLDDSVRAEDVQTARCLAQVGVLPLDSRDAQARERFHPFPPDAMFFDAALASHALWRIHKDWFPFYVFPKVPDPAHASGPAIGVGPNCCAPDSLSFHLYLKKSSPKSHDESLYFRLHLLLYGGCPLTLARTEL